MDFIDPNHNNNNRHDVFVYQTDEKDESDESFDTIGYNQDSVEKNTKRNLDDDKKINDILVTRENQNKDEKAYDKHSDTEYATIKMVLNNKDNNRTFDGTDKMNQGKRYGIAYSKNIFHKDENTSDSVGHTW